MGERELLRWIRTRIPAARKGVVVDSGDDTAVVRIDGRHVLMTTDSVIDGVHFDGRTARPGQIGHKAMARSLSDIAAMGGVPRFAVVAVMVPRRASRSRLRTILRGMERTAERFGTAIVGGDVAGHDGRLSINVSVLGETGGRAPVRRRGAKPGDLLAVTGTLGGSILGRHLRFVPRIREARDLGRRFTLRAMIDLSDGLATDLAHLCHEGGVGAVLRERDLPISAAARRLARRSGRPPVDHALTDGEDYELLFAIPKGQGKRLARSGMARVIGEVVARRGIRLQTREGGTRAVGPAGWEHRF